MKENSNIILSFQDEGISRIKINDTTNYNALSSKNISSLIDIFKSLNNDNNTKVIIIEGAGKGFSAGHDLKEIRSLKNKPKYKKLFNSCSKLMMEIIEGRKPVIAKVHGAAFAEAITLARASGVNLKTFQEVLKPSAGNSRVIEYRGPLMIDDEYSDLNVKTADLTIMMKDNELIEQYAKDYRVPVPVFLNSMSLTYAALSQGYGDHDPGVITRICEQMAGIPR